MALPLIRKLYSIYQNISLRKKIGIVCLVSTVLINQYTWIIFFDQDGYIKDSKKTIFLVIDFLLFSIGTFLILFENQRKSFFKFLSYIFYCLTVLEISSFLALKIIFQNNKTLEMKIKNIMGNNVTKYEPDLRSDYKPNILHPDVNRFGFRYGGQAKKNNIFRIMCIGESTTWGDLAKDSVDTYPAQLEIYLKSKGFLVDVINAGVPSHTSLDVLMRLITKGMYFDPDMILIHTGGNDNAPLQSPYKYKEDYTHWRTVGYRDNKIFKHIWHKFPLSSLRLFLVLKTDMEFDISLSRETSTISQNFTAESKVNRSRTSGFINYFSSIIFLAKSNKIVPVTILINIDHHRKNSLAKKRISKEKLNYAIKRDSISTMLHNALMDSISKTNDVPIIRFDKFEPSSQNFWYDHAHLTEKGIKEKAVFIGNFLIENKLLKKPYE